MTAPNDIRKPRLIHQLSLTAGAALLVFSGTAHGVNLSTVPLFLSSPVDPNIMFVLDDSGSMHYEVTPDEDFRFGGFNENTRFVFPRASQVYGSADYNSNVVTTEDSHIFNFRGRSPQINKTYYNPGITYRPWSNPDGSLMPNANPEQAFHNIRRPDRGFRNLTVFNSDTDSGDPANPTSVDNWRSCDGPSAAQCTSVAGPQTFWPATYFWYTGPNDDAAKWSTDNFVEVTIENGETYTGHGRDNRTDCENGSCTYAQEIQNFANWYQYHRSRVLASRGGIGNAFARQPETVRVGYGTINASSRSVDGVTTSTIVDGVRPFSGQGRDRFFDTLYDRTIPASGTPLRRALQDAGEYFSRSDDRGPWSTTPGESGGEDLECRHSYTILMSDGYWSGNSPNVGNVDNADGSTITGPSGESYQYEAGPPFSDTYSNTLADVAMEYWKNDLRTDLDNRVPTSPLNPAFWQHMVTFAVGLGVQGAIDPDDAFNAIASGDNIDWPNPSNSESAKIDDMLHAAVNSRGGFFSAADPDAFAEELGGVLENITSRSGASVTSVATNSTELQPDGTNVVYQARFNSADWSGDIRALELDVVALTFSESWSAAENLPGPTARNIFTHDGSTGVTFEWSAISDAQQASLNDNSDLLTYLRGDSGNELRNGGSFRNRSTPLGDIVNSNPVYQGADLNFGYGFQDDYMAFRQANRNRAEVVYVGSNAGMLHAFHAETGEELFAYVPSMLFNKLPELADPNYSHQFYVDGQQHIAHAQIGGSWRTVLIGTLGAGARGLYALDVTDPENFSADDVLWEISGTDPDIGHIFGDATVGQTANGEWSVLFGNGYGSGNGDATLFVVNLATGNVTRRIETGASPANGLSPAVFRSNPDRIIQDGFAGDLQGNLWKFDLTSTNNTGQWGVTYGSGNNSQPLFTATGPNGEVQPITAKPAVGSHPNGGSIVLFGTGKFIEVDDNQVVANPDVQSVYGVRDKSDTSAPLDRNDLVVQNFIGQATIAGTPVRATSDVTFTEDDDGWLLDLDYPEARGERVITQPVLVDGRVEFVTLTPFDDPCAGGGTSSLFALNAATGGRPSSPIFDVNRDGDFDAGDTVTVTVNGEDIEVPPSAIDPGLGIMGRPTLIRNPADGRLYRVLSGTEGEGIEEAPLATQLQPRSWLQLR